MPKIRKGTTTFTKTAAAFFAAGFNTFAILYCVQPLMPELSAAFDVSPAAASWTLSGTTIALAAAMLVFGTISEVYGRKRLMVLTMFAASILCFLTAFMPGYTEMVAMRTLTGVALAGLPAVAMAYLGEEIEPGSLGAAMGLYISGNAAGAVFGRVFSGVTGGMFGWETAVAGTGLISIAAAVVFWKSLPESQHFKAKQADPAALGKGMLYHLQQPAMICLFLMGFMLLGSNTALFTFIGYELMQEPYSMSQTLVGWLFLIMIVGMFSSVLTGRLLDRFGRQQVLIGNLLLAAGGTALTLVPDAVVKIIGIGVFTFGFFISHSVASGWVSQLAATNKSQASSIYLFLYYGGSTAAGPLGGLIWSGGGWPGLAGLTLAFLLTAVLLALLLVRLTSVKEEVRVPSRA
ncbi:MFS transporter [Alkalicoccus luteus]|uniref:MFS transporter n=1 Tax=Alkalicoccus luteus TaxID=1237094 RepID=UPI004033B14C